LTENNESFKPKLCMVKPCETKGKDRKARPERAYFKKAS